MIIWINSIERYDIECIYLSPVDNSLKVRLDSLGGGNAKEFGASI